MSRKLKLLQKLLDKNPNFTFRELVTLLSYFGYVQIKTGKTAGSRVAFYNEEINHLIHIHKPHPGNQLKKYQINFIIQTLINNHPFFNEKQD